MDNPDSLKPLENICDPDPRHKGFVISDEDVNNFRQITLQDYHYYINAIKLNGNVPGKIRNQFDTARNLLLYSWYVYRFATVAELQAFSSVEFALKEKVKLCNITNKRSSGLKNLLNIAKEEGWIKDKGFSNYMRQKKEQKNIEQLDFLSDNKVNQQDNKELQEYCNIICNSFPFLRNEIAHGSEYLNMPGNALFTLEVCADIIIQLFQEKT